MKPSRTLMKAAVEPGTSITRHANFAKPVTFFEPSFLPKLPKIRPPVLHEGLSRPGKKAAYPSIRTLAFDGDSYLGVAAARAVRDSEQFSLAADSHRAKALLTCNVTLSYLGLAYKLAEGDATISQKAAADRFEAHIGALYRQAKQEGRRKEVDEFMSKLFSAKVWPLLAGEEESAKEA